MFTGLVQCKGAVQKIAARGTGLRLEICAPIATPDDPLVLGESIAVNGACLTVTGVTESGVSSRSSVSAVADIVSPTTDSSSLNGASPRRQVSPLSALRSPLSTFTADVLEETLRCTAFGKLKVGDEVNLERALKVGDRLGGHLVSGHVDEVGTLIERRAEGNDVVFRIGCSERFARGTIRKGSVTVSGTSLTVCAVGYDWFEVALIPTTLRETILGNLAQGDRVHLEADLIGAYVRRALGQDERSLEHFIAAGFAD